MRSMPRLLVQNKTIAVAAILVTTFLIARAAILVQFEVFTSYDTSSYSSRPSGGGLVRTLSFTGHAPRMWGVPLFYSLTSTDYVRALIQWLIGTVSWAVLGVALAMHLRSMAAKVAVLVATFTLGLVPAVTRWDYAILSESLSISLFVLTIGLFAIWLRYGSPIVLALMTAVAFWWTFTRQDILAFAALLTLVVAVFGFRSRTRRRQALVSALVLTLGLAWHAALVPTIDRSYSAWGKGFRVSEATFLYRLRFLILKDPHMRAVYENRFGMPPCDATEAAAADDVSMTVFVEEFRRCSDLRTWVAEHGGDSGYRYAFADPIHHARVLAGTLPKALDNSMIIDPIPIFPAFVNDVVFPSGTVVLPGVLGLTVAALAAGVLMKGLRRRRWLFAAGVTLIVAGIGNLMLSFTFGWSDFVRYGIQEAIILRIGVLILIATAVDVSVTKRRETATPSLHDEAHE